MKTPFVGSGSLVTLIVLGLALAPSRPAEAQEAIAVIVHPDNPLTTISRDELRRFYLGTSTTLPNRESVLLLESSTVRERFYATALGMSLDRVKRHWIGVVFSGQSGTPPKEVGGPDELRQFVATHRGAIAFLAARDVSGSVKILAVDGLRPSDPRYPLK